jgi:signal peptidase I
MRQNPQKSQSLKAHITTSFPLDNDELVASNKAETTVVIKRWLSWWSLQYTMMHSTMRFALLLLLLAAQTTRVSGFIISHAFHAVAAGRTRQGGLSRQSRARLRQSDESIQQESLNTDESGANSCPTHSYSAVYKATLSLPNYAQLMQIQYGECYLSEPFTVTDAAAREHSFCIKCYPRGGGHGKQSKSGFGMAYKILPFVESNPVYKFGVYLQYLPANENDTVDVSFTLRLRGRASFDVEWRSGMRFVALSQTKLAQGRANDFGSHLMQTDLLSSFLAIDKDIDNISKPIELIVALAIHNTTESYQAAIANQESQSRQGWIQDLRESGNPEDVRVGSIVVPVLTSIKQRPQMFRQGVYPGVEYRILRMIDPATNKDVWYRHPHVEYDLKPIYPLVRQLERPWPVRIKDEDIPKLVSSNTYNIGSAIGSLITALAGLTLAFTISQVVSLFVIPSLSMDPTLQKGDVILVEKVSPNLPLLSSYQRNSVIFFRPPSQLQDLVTRTGGRIADRDLFVKRIAGVPGDQIKVDRDGSVTLNEQTLDPAQRAFCQAEPLKLIEKYIEGIPTTLIEPDQVFVLGDCSGVSIDSRVWGPLPQSDIVGRPLLRIWPLERWGPIGGLP